MLLLIALLQQLRLAVGQVENHLPKEPVGPRKPRICQLAFSEIHV